MKKKNYTKEKRLINNILYNCYVRLTKVPLMEKYLFKIRSVYALLVPTDEFSISVMTVSLALKAIISSISVFILCILIGKMHIYSYFIIAIMLIIINTEMINRNFQNAQLRLLKQLENYLGDVRYYFHNNGVLEDAIFESLGEAEYEISLHINLMYELLISDEREKTYAYKDIAPNKFFMTLFALCELVMRYGDTIKDNNSLFLENLNSLRDEIRNELLKLNKIKYVFSGLWLICIIPPFTLKLIEIWGESNISELKLYYDGRYGLVTSVIICVSSLITYSVINGMKENHRYTEKNYFFTKKISHIDYINNMLINYMFKNPEYVNKTNIKLKRAAYNIPIKEYILKKWLNGVSAIVILAIIWTYYYLLPGVNKNNTNYVFVIIPFSMIVVFISYKMCDIELDLRMFFLKHAMEDEIMAYHSIISMLMYIKRMDVETVLEWLENFSQIYKSSLIQCCNDITYDEDKALLDLENSEAYPPFVRIVENLRCSDRVGLEKAFEEIYSQRKYYIEKRKQDNEISINNKGAIGRVIAFIPMVITIGLYLIIPFVLESLKQLSGYATGM